MVISFIAFALNPYPHSAFKAGENRCQPSVLPRAVSLQLPRRF
jgi:hypothetical protein